MSETAAKTTPTGQARPRRIPRPRFSRRVKNPDGSMSIVEHLQELRKRVLIALTALVLGTIIGFIWYQQAPPGFMTLGEIIRGPYCSLNPEDRISLGPDETCRLLATSPYEMFLLRLKAGAIAGFVFASPVIFYQVWAYVTPGLRKKERRWTIIFVVVSAILFLMGVVLSYFILDYGLQFLMTMGDEASVAALTGHEYFNFVIGMVLIFGISFEMPLLVIALNQLGVLRYEHIKGKRRYIIIALAVFSAIATPGQDPFGMLGLTLALMLLIEIAFQVCRITDKRRQRERPEWMDLDDDEASQAPVTASRLDSDDDVARPAPIAAPQQRPVAQPVSAPTPGAWNQRSGDGGFDDVL